MRPLIITHNEAKVITNPSVAKVEYNEGMISRAVPQLNADNETVGVLDSRQNGGAECTIDRTLDRTFSKTQG